VRSLAGLQDYSNDSYPVQRIVKRRELPLPGEVQVQKGDELPHDALVAKITLKPGIPWVVDLGRHLGLESSQIPDTMLVEVGEEVETGQVIAKGGEGGVYGMKEYEAPTDGIIEDISDKSGRVVIREEFGKEEPPVSFDAAFELGCKPREVPDNMLVEVGQEVKKGAIIAKKGEQSAFFTKAARAPISGIVTEVNDSNGYVTISRPFKEVIVDAYVQGEVTEILPQFGAVIETKGVLINGVFGLGPENHGELMVLSDEPDKSLTEDMITEDLAGKVVVVGGFATDEALEKAQEVGVTGVVCATASYLNLVNSLGVKLGVGITGQEDIDMTVILMEGFGRLTMWENSFDAFKQLDGLEVSLNGRTQIRAGAIRPEVVCPFPDYDGPLHDPEAIDEELEIGQRVRIVSDPYFGELGKIVEIPHDPMEIGTEAFVPVVRVELRDDSEVAVVPRKNVELY